ncbi:MAG: leucine-rich repeat protein [Clostridia bacterium]|nr:leucine-rich repeat protein [Clostridia bacterium]
MKKKTGILLAIVLTVACLIALFTVIAIAEDLTEKDTITISYMSSQDTTSTTTSLDTTAYAGGKQVVEAGEKFTLPTTSNNIYAGQDGFQLIWYTEDGRTYKAGETVSFDKDTKLFRCVAKECYTISDVNYAMTNESKAAILMADITTGVGIDVRDQDQAILVLNGHTMNFTRNGDIMGNQRSGKHIYGTGTLNITSVDGKVGSHYVFNCQGHGYNGTQNKTVIGRDVTINAPDFWLAQDWDGTNPHYPWIRIYGNVDVYGIMISTAGPTRTQLIEVFENAVVKINGPTLHKTKQYSSNTQYYFNNHAIQTRIYGGTFYLPAEAASAGFWTDDNVEEYMIGNVKYSPRELTAANKDIIKITGGSFVLPDGLTPAIADYLTEDVIEVMHDGGNGLVTNNNTSTYCVPIVHKGAYKFAFDKYNAGTPAKLVVTAFDGTKKEYRYETTKTADGKAIATITIYEPSVKIVDGAETTVYETVTDDFSFIPGENGLFVFKNAETSLDYELQSFEANETVFQTVVPAGCEHNFEGTTVEASCDNAPYADYNCSVCGHNVHFSWGEKLAHNYVLGEHKEATVASLGSKTYTCSLCGETKTTPYSLDPTSLEIAVTIRLDDGTFENVTVLASEIFDFALSGTDGDYIYTLSAIKEFGDYKIRNIYGVTIPQGILYMNIATHNEEKYNNEYYGLVELNIADGATINIQNIGNLRKVEKITVGENTDVTFGASCSWYSPNNEKRNMQKIATIDLSAGNHKVVFLNDAFNDRGTLANLILGESSSYDFYYRAFYNCAITEIKFPATNTYSFGQESFYGNDMTELAFPNGVDLTFGQGAFQKCPNLTSVKFGENATYNISNYAFIYSPIEKVVFTANSTYTVGSQAFVNAALTEIDMSAGNMTVTLNNGAFNCWRDNKLTGAVTSIKFGENSTYVISEASFNDVLVTELKLAPNSNYTFKRYFINGGDNRKTFTTFDASASNITLLVESEAFRNHKEVFTNLLINGEGSTYTFNGSAFYDTKIAEITLGKGSTYTFNNCFNGSTPIAKVDASADNLNVTVNAYGWGKNTLATVLINGKNGTYTFNSEAFRSSIFTELTLGEGSTYNFNSNCYSSTNNLKKIDASANNVEMIVANNVFNGKSALEALDISGENSTYSFGQECFKNSKIQEIKLGEGSSYDFGYMCFRDCGAIKTLDFTASNVTAKFANQVFDGRSTVAYIAFGENSAYTIGDYVFRNTSPTNDIVFSNTSSFKIGREAFYSTDFASITFEDNCDVEFTGVDAFKNSDKATSLYIGENIAITNYPFRNLKALETLYIMDGVTHANEYEFEYAGSSDYKTPLYVYNHSYELTFNKGMFKECDGVFVYTVTDNIGTSNEVFANCGDTSGFKAWTVYLGIPHPLIEGFISAPNCTEEGVTGWVTDTALCSCGFQIDENTVINKYEKKHNITADTAPDDQISYEVVIAAALGHDYGVENPVRIDWIYVNNNYFENAKNKHNCTACGVDYLGKDIENSALFKKKGTTVSENGKDAIAHVIYANLEAIDAYNLFLGEGNEIKYGVVAGLSTEDGKPVNSDGSANGRSFAFEFSGTEFSIIQIKLIGITNEEQGLYCCSYIIVGGEVMYIHNETVKSTATIVSLANPNGIVAAEENVNIEAVIDNKEKIYA